MVTEVTCYTGTIDSTVSFTWYIDSTDNVLPGQTTGVTNGATASILQLTSTKQLNNKKLYCSATNQCGTGTTDYITLDIQYPPTVHADPSTSPYKIIEGNQLILTCTVDDSNPQPTSFTWSKDGGSITGQRSSVFRLTSVQRSQAGQYTCTANNVVGTGTSTSVQVDVLYPPTVSTPSIYKILESSELTITCSSIPGNPTASYRWTGPGGYSSTGATLRITDIKRSQTGVYTCTATNTMIPTSTNIQQTGTGTSQTTIDVLYGPIVSVLSETVVVEEPNRLTLTCTVDSNPVSTITWYGPDGREDLVINNINRNQSGIYNCTAITDLQPTNGNQLIKTDSKTVLVDVRYPPTVYIEPSTSPYKIIQGNQLTLTCTVDDSDPQPTSFTWSKDGVSITGQRSSVFRLTSVQRSHAGQYTCTANNGVGTGTSTSVQVDVLYPPTVSTPSIYKILESTGLTITCSGNPLVTSYRWTGPGGYSSTGSTLTIPDIKRNQTGVYRCTATNIMIPTSPDIQQTGTGTNQTTIYVLYGPIVYLSSESVVIEESNSLTVTCTVDSNPVSTIKWYGPDGRVVSNNKDLVINNINRNQSGVYNCTAITVLQPTNGNQLIKTDSKTVQVDVRYLDPVIIQSDKTDVDEGQSFNLSCSTNSNPIANMTWSTPDSSTKELTTNSINYYKATSDCLDTGIYTCTAVNSHIQTTVTNLSQDVNIRCSLRQYPYVKPVMTVVGNVSETVQLSVSILAYPQPTFTWYRLDKPININDGRYQQEDIINSTNIFMSTLNVKINSSDFYGDYKVNISNDIDHIILTITLTTQSVPDVPSEFILDSLSHSSICIKLKPGFDGGDTQKFIFEHSVDNKTWTSTPTVELTEEGSVLNGCIENLNPDTEYFVRVIASNRYGSSKPVHLVIRQPLRTSANLHASVEKEVGTITALIFGLCFAVAIIIGLIILVIYQCRKLATSGGNGKTRRGASRHNTNRNNKIFESTL
ncbi:LOW QUALITY PROTEIN: hemicentin-1 [Patella vulgata]|uniref:LOW QUALITY PROTEIN: hemicentin-1 n=1 Tax=Patella vulgata TaxID=6465 RepID=UPI0024A880AD|nr:LOW QUALITY PROTEIN: hemicentin-1 [Patella vulgata]